MPSNDDNGDFKESKDTKMKVEDIVPFSVFQKIGCDDHCDGRHPETCKGLDRVIAAMDYHQWLAVNPLDEKYGDDPKAAFIAFCDELYPRIAMLNDYIHFVEHHADPASIEYIKSRLQMQCQNATKCAATSRHYRDRRQDDHSGMESNWYIDRIDTIHFMVHHLTELGLRVSAEVMESVVISDDEKVNESVLFDGALKRMAEEVESKQAVFPTERLDGVVNAKFTLQINQGNDGGAGMEGNGLYSPYMCCTLCSTTKQTTLSTSCLHGKMNRK